MKRLKHTLCILLALVLTLTSLTLLPVSAEADGETVITVPITVQEEYNMAQEFFEVLNKNRADAGKYEYILDDRLMDLAMERAAQCCIYFGHNSLVYSNYDAMSGTYIDKYGKHSIDIFMQEDIAEGTADAQSTYTVWYNSNGHRPLLTDIKNYKYCGIGVVTYHGKREWVLVVSNAPVGNIIEGVSGSKIVTKNINAKAKYFSQCIYRTINADEREINLTDDGKTDTDFIFADISSHYAGYYVTQSGIFTFKSNNPELFSVDGTGRITPKTDGTGSMTVYYKNSVELLTVPVKCGLIPKVTSAPTPRPTEAPDSTEVVKPTTAPKPTQAVKPAATKFTVKTKNVTYDGKAQQPSVAVYTGNKKLSSKYYSVSYKNNKNVGYGTVTVKGKGSYAKYSGSATFKINLKNVSLSSVKAQKKKITVSWKKTGGNQGYQIQYSTSKNFKSNVRKANISAKKGSVTIKNIHAKKRYYVRIRSYKKVGNKVWYTGWSKIKNVKTK